MVDDLEKRVEERKKQASERDIYRKALTVAEYLGAGHRSEGASGREDTHFVYREDALKIEYTSKYEYVGSIDLSLEGGSSLTIEFKKQVVYEYASGLNTYLPGTRTWEKKMNELYPQALSAKEKKETDAAAQKKKQENDARAQTAKRFGI